MIVREGKSHLETSLSNQCTGVRFNGFLSGGFTTLQCSGYIDPKIWLSVLFYVYESTGHKKINSNTVQSLPFTAFALIIRLLDIIWGMLRNQDKNNFLLINP